MSGFINKLKQFFNGGRNPEPESSPSPSKTAERPYEVESIQQTPNPDAVQFVLDHSVIAQGSRTFNSPEEAQGDPFAEALFNIFGVESVYLNENFVTITKSPVRGWNNMVEEIKTLLQTRLTQYPAAPQSGQEEIDLDPEIREFTPEVFMAMDDQQKHKVIDALIEHSIRPALASDGGGLILQGVSGNTVRIEYQGACGSCPSSRTGTLQYIETLLKENLHPDLQIQAI